MNLEAIRAKKTVLMYCTGGIRCENASLYLAHRAPNTRVLQLEGGIHKYLDEFPGGGHFVGANMVFDGRLAMASQDPTVLGKCVQCAAAYDKLDDKVLCDVCKSFVLLCDGCRDLYDQKGWRVYCAEHILLAAAAGAPEAEDPKHKGRMAKRSRTEAHAPPSAAATAADPAAAASSADAVPAASSGSPAADVDADAAGDGEGSVDAQAAADSVGCSHRFNSSHARGIVRFGICSHSTRLVFLAVHSSSAPVLGSCALLSLAPISPASSAARAHVGPSDLFAFRRHSGRDTDRDRFGHQRQRSVPRAGSISRNGCRSARRHHDPHSRRSDTRGRQTAIQLWNRFV